MPSVALMRKPSSWNLRATSRMAGLSSSVTEMKTVPLRGSGGCGGFLGLEVGQAEGGRHAQHLAGGAHLRSEHRVDFGEHVEGQHDFLHAEVRDGLRCCRFRSLSFVPSMSWVAMRAMGTLQTLETSGTVREARGLASST